MDSKNVRESGQENLLHHLKLAEKRGLPARKRTCVIMFIDIVGFSTFASRSTDSDALDLVRRFEHVVRNEVSASGGRVVMTAGDAVMACWHGRENLGSAAGCARQIKQRLDAENRQRPKPETIRIRAGIHCGQVLELQDGDIIGRAVNLSCRLQTAAKPGEILISAEASNIGEVCNEMPASHKIGNMRLKGFDHAVAVCCLSERKKTQWLKPVTDALASPFKLMNWSRGSWAFIVAGLLLGLGMAVTPPSVEFPHPELTAAGLFALFFGWAFLWACYRPRTVSFLHPFFRSGGMLAWSLIVIFAGGYCGCWPG